MKKMIKTTPKLNSNYSHSAIAKSLQNSTTRISRAQKMPVFKQNSPMILVFDD